MLFPFRHEFFPKSLGDMAGGYTDVRRDEETCSEWCNRVMVMAEPNDRKGLGREALDLAIDLSEHDSRDLNPDGFQSG